MTTQNAINELATLIGKFELFSIEIVDTHTMRVNYPDNTGESESKIFKDAIEMLEWLEQNRSQQSIQNGTEVVFNSGSHAEELCEDFNLTDEELEKLEGKNAKVVSLAYAVALGDKDCEYYNVVFEDNTKLEGVSGYHLSPKN